MSEPVCAEIFIIGNEILIGDIQDTNTNWLCREINRLGGHVARVTVMRDIDAVIVAELQAALGRGANVIITSGGLGPTADDLTLAAVARGAGVELRLHDQALQMVRQRYDELAGQGILPRRGRSAAQSGRHSPGCPVQDRPDRHHQPAGCPFRTQGYFHQFSSAVSAGYIQRWNIRDANHYRSMQRRIVDGTGAQSSGR